MYCNLENNWNIFNGFQRLLVLVYYWIPSQRCFLYFASRSMYMCLHTYTHELTFHPVCICLTYIHTYTYFPSSMYMSYIHTRINLLSVGAQSHRCDAIARTCIVSICTDTCSWIDVPKFGTLVTRARRNMPAVCMYVCMYVWCECIRANTPDKLFFVISYMHECMYIYIYIHTYNTRANTPTSCFL